VVRTLMREDHLIRIEKEAVEGILRYRIFGLNLFAANTTEGTPNLLALQDMPALKFLGPLIARHETLCLLGSPGPGNWMNERRRQGQKASIEDLLGPGTSYQEIPISYYGGGFRPAEGYGPSILFKLADQEMLHNLPTAFLSWDALVLVLYLKGENGLPAAADGFVDFKTEPALINRVLARARCLMLTEGDCQYLEIYAKDPQLEDDLEAGRLEAESWIKSTPWYQANKESLVWDDLELCYVKR